MLYDTKARAMDLLGQEEGTLCHSVRAGVDLSSHKSLLKLRTMSP